jgi:ADP-ribosyl-[dinitrogen reductase] hydrolase
MRKTFMTHSRADQIAGVILGTAVGDALGLPREALRPHRASKMFGGSPLRQRFFLGRGMISDDTEHTCMVGQSLLSCPDDPSRFARTLAWKLRWWLLGVPAGVGRATLLGILRLWLGFSPQRSGIFSAGNGPAMRSALLGVCLGDQPERLAAYVRAATRLTHTDPRAELGAWLIARAAYLGATAGPAGVTADAFFRLVQEGPLQPDRELQRLLATMERHARQGDAAEKVAEELGLQRGVTGYVYHTVPLALYCWLRAPGDFRAAVEEVILLGGDTDTTGAITGALVGATVGVQGIPAEWLNGILDWPRTGAWMRTLADRLALAFATEEPRTQKQVPLFWPGILPRNLFFFLVVLVHILRRLLPPY